MGCEEEKWEGECNAKMVTERSKKSAEKSNRVMRMCVKAIKCIEDIGAKVANIASQQAETE